MPYGETKVYFDGSHYIILRTNTPGHFGNKHKDVWGIYFGHFLILLK